MQGFRCADCSDGGRHNALVAGVVCRGAGRQIGDGAVRSGGVSWPRGKKPAGQRLGGFEVRFGIDIQRPLHQKRRIEAGFISGLNTEASTFFV